MENLGINWKILTGQIINFTILFFLLKMFVFKPFLAAMKKRKETIEQGLKKTEEAEKSLQGARDLSVRIKEAGERSARDLIIGAEVKAQAKARDIADQAQDEKEKIIKAGRETLGKERTDQQKGLEKESLDKAFLLAEKILKEKLDEKKDKKIIEEAISGLGQRE